mgnify:CR=1 FL=1
MLAVIGNVALVRLVGFISTVLGVNYPPALALQYLAIAFAIGAGSYAIARGIIIEPPAFLTDTLTSAFALARTRVDQLDVLAAALWRLSLASRGVWQWLRRARERRSERQPRRLQASPPTDASAT